MADTVDQSLSQQLAMSACVREASFRAPLIRHEASKAAHGPAADARYHFDQAMKHTKALLETLERQQLAMGWTDGGADG